MFHMHGGVSPISIAWLLQLCFLRLTQEQRRATEASALTDSLPSASISGLVGYSGLPLLQLQYFRTSRGAADGQLLIYDPVDSQAEMLHL